MILLKCTFALLHVAWISQYIAKLSFFTYSYHYLRIVDITQEQSINITFVAGASTAMVGCENEIKNILDVGVYTSHPPDTMEIYINNVNNTYSNQPSKSLGKFIAKTPTNIPSKTASITPTKSPANIPSKTPTNFPSNFPTNTPTNIPTTTPIHTPTAVIPTTANPSINPAKFSSKSPSETATNIPSNSPSPSPFACVLIEAWSCSKELFFIDTFLLLFMCITFGQMNYYLNIFMNTIYIKSTSYLMGSSAISISLHNELKYVPSCINLLSDSVIIHIVPKNAKTNIATVDDTNEYKQDETCVAALSSAISTPIINENIPIVCDVIGKIKTIEWILHQYHIHEYLEKQIIIFIMFYSIIFGILALATYIIYTNIIYTNIIYIHRTIQLLSDTRTMCIKSNTKNNTCVIFKI